MGQGMRHGMRLGTAFSRDMARANYDRLNSGLNCCKVDGIAKRVGMSESDQPSGLVWCCVPTLHVSRPGLAESPHNIRNDFARMRNDGDHHRMLVRLRFLQCLELAVEQLRRHEVPVARGQPP